MSTPAEVLRRYLEAFPDVEAVGAHLHDSVAFELFSPATGPRTGRERIMGGLAKEFRTIYHPDSFHLEVLLVFGDEKHAAAKFRITADTRFGVPYTNDYAVLARVVDGLIVEGWEWVDTAGAAAQLGAAMAAKRPGATEPEATP